MNDRTKTTTTAGTNAAADTMTDIQRPWWKRIGWLVLIWVGSVAALGLVAWLFRLLMRSAGMMPPGA